MENDRFEELVKDQLKLVQTGDTKAFNQIVNLFRELLAERRHRQDAHEKTPDERVKRLLTWATEKGYQLDLVRVGDVEMKAPYHMGQGWKEATISDTDIETARNEKAALRESTKLLDAIKNEIQSFYDLLDRDAHNAGSRALTLSKIEEILGMKWEP